MFAVIVGSQNVREEMTAMINAMRGHRGGLRTHVDKARGVALFAGSARLLPEDGFDSSPYVNEGLCFVGSGRIDNRAELADELGLESGWASTTSDVQLLHCAYQRWGGDCGNHLAGQYAFCAVDVRTGDVTASVDHLGTLPLLYAFVQGRHIIATQAAAMLGHPLLRNAVPDVAATAVLITGRLPRGGTAFREIMSLPGGHTLHAPKGGPANQHKWWKPWMGEVVRYGGTNDYVEHATQLFTRAVRDRLRSMSGISASVSGGLDSSLVAAVAASELQGRPLRMYTAVPEKGIPCADRPGWDNDESSLVSDLASAHATAIPAWVSFADVSPLQVARETRALSHTPVRNTANQVWFRAMCQQTVAHGSRVLLTGERGNATISAGAEVAIGRLFTQRPWAALRLALQDAEHGGRSVLRTFASEVRWRLRGRAAARTKAWYGEGFLAAALLDRLRPHFEEIGDLRLQEEQVRFASSPSTFFRRDEIVHSGVELRDPTGDKRLIELLLSFPPEAFFAGGRPRGLAREMGAGYVPDSIRLRRRRGMQVPEHCGLILSHANEYRDALDVLESSPACRDSLQLDRAREALNQLCSGEINLRAAVTLDRMIDVGLFWSEHGL